MRKVNEDLVKVVHISQLKVVGGKKQKKRVRFLL